MLLFRKVIINIIMFIPVLVFFIRTVYKCRVLKNTTTPVIEYESMLKHWYEVTLNDTDPVVHYLLRKLC